MIIDAHAHVGDFRWSPADRRPPMTWELLLRRLDDEGIDRAVFLPVYNGSPEQMPWGFLAAERMLLRDQVLDARRYADRIVAFGNIDPRWGGNHAETDFGPILDWFQEQGCRGMGELCANLPYDDPRNVNLFRQLGSRGLPVTVESCHAGWGLGYQDEPGSPRLERLLRLAPDTAVIGHGPAFWAEIAPVVDGQAKAGYPRGPVIAEGSLARLFRTCPNLAADLSAASAFNALSRDLDHAVRFLNEFQDRLLFGTDIISRDLSRRDGEQLAVDALLDELFAEGRTSEARWRTIAWHDGLMPQLDLLRRLRESGRLSPAAWSRITGGNAARLLGLAPA
jgi:predicted TIM-barrel fold metal-dependent hydrolase